MPDCFLICCLDTIQPFQKLFIIKVEVDVQLVHKRFSVVLRMQAFVDFFLLFTVDGS